MASAFSIVRQYGSYAQPFDFGLLQAGLEYKQNKFDANLAKIQSEIDEFASIDLLKSEDKKYLHNRLENILGTVNSFGAIDLSSNGVTRNITNLVSESIDDNVLTAFQSTQNFRSLQKDIEDVKKNNPKGYSSINEAYSMQGARKWLNDGKTGSSYKGGTYTPFTDVQGNLDKQISEIRKNKGEESMTIRETDINGQPTGYMITKKVKELSAEEIRTVVSNSLAPQDKKQLEINGWYNFSQVSNADATDYLQTYKDERIKLLDGEIANQRVKSSSIKDAEKKKEITDRINYLQRQKNNFVTTVDNIDSNSTSIGTFLEEQRLMNGLVSKHNFKEVSIDYKTDQAYWKNLDYNYKVAKDIRDFDYKQAKDNRDYELDLEKLRVQKENSKTSSKSKKEAAATNGIVTTSEMVGKFESPETAQDIINNTESSINKKTAIVLDLLDNLQGESKSQFNDLFEAAKLENPDKTNDELKLMIFDSYGAESPLFNLEPGKKDELHDIDDDIEFGKRAVSQSVPSVTDISDESWEKVLNTEVDNFYFNDIVTNPDTNERYTIEELNRPENRDKKKEFQAFVVADHFLSDLPIWNRNRSGWAETENFADNKMVADYYIKNLSEIFGEEVTYDDIFTTTTGKTGVPGNDLFVGKHTLKTDGTKYPLIKGSMEGKSRKEGGSKTLDFLLDMMRSKGGDRRTTLPFQTQDSFDDSPLSRNLFGFSEQKSTFNNNLTEFQRNLPDKKVVTFGKESAFYSNLGNAFIGGNDSAGNPHGYVLTANQPFNVRKIDSGQRASYEISQSDRKGGVRKSYINEEDFFRLTNKEGDVKVLDVFDKNTENNSNSIKRLSPTRTKVNSFKNGRKNYDYFTNDLMKRKYYSDRPEILNTIEIGSAKNLLRQDFGYKFKDDKGNSTEYEKLMNKVLAMPYKFDVISEPSKDEEKGLIKLVYKNEFDEEEVFYQKEFSPSDYKVERHLSRITPEKFVFEALYNTFSIQSEYDIQGWGESEEFSELKNLFTNAR